MTDTTAAPALQQFPAGQPRTITAAVTNRENTTVPDTLTWSATSGTLTVATDTLSARLDNPAVGTVTVTVTDSSGLTAAADFVVVDAVPAAISLSVA